MSIDNVVYPCGFLKPMGTPKFFIVFCLVTLHLDVPTTFLYLSDWTTNSGL